MKKGHLIIELVICMSIMFLIIGSVSSLFISEYKDFIKSVGDLDIENSIEDAYTYIEALIKSAYVEDIIVADNSLTIGKNNGKSYVIKEGKNSVDIIYCQGNEIKKSSELLENVSDFEIEKKGNLLFITFTIDGRVGGDERCISIKRKDIL